MIYTTVVFASLPRRGELSKGAGSRPGRYPMRLDGHRVRGFVRPLCCWTPECQLLDRERHRPTDGPAKYRAGQHALVCVMEPELDNRTPCYDMLSTAAQRHVDEAVAKLYEHLRSVEIHLGQTRHVLAVTEAAAAWIISTTDAKWLKNTRVTVQNSHTSADDIMEWWRLNWRDPNVYVAGRYVTFDKTPDDGV